MLTHAAAPTRSAARWGLIGVVLGWAVVGAAVAWSALPSVEPDARVLVGAASTLGPLAAVASALALSRGRDRVAGLALILSVATPTYFAWALNLPALVLGVWLVVRRAPARA